jgi:hypothetical protein
MKTSWFKGLDKQDEIDLKQTFKEALVMRKRLDVMLKDKIQLSHKKSFSEKGYDNANWAYLQADARGYERALNDVIELIL